MGTAGTSGFGWIDRREHRRYRRERRGHGRERRGRGRERRGHGRQRRQRGIDRGSAAGTGGVAGTAGSTGGTTATPPLAFDVSTLTDPAVPGGRLHCTITIGNRSSAAIGGVSLNMSLPVGLQFNFSNDAAPNATTCGGTSTCSSSAMASWTIGSIPARESRTITINALVLTTVADGTSLNTSFTLNATGMNATNLIKTTQIQMQPSSQLATGTATYPVLPGGRFTLDLDAGQLGVNALAGTALQVTLAAGLTVASISDGGTETVPGVVTWNIGAVGVGAALHREVDVTVDGSVPAGSILATRATLTYDGGLAVDAAAEYAIPVAMTLPDLTLKTAIEPAPTAPNGRLNEIITVTNRGTRAVDAVTLWFRVPVGIQFNFSNDSAPNLASCAGVSTCAPGAEASWTLGTIAAGASVTISMGSYVQQAMVGNGNLIRSEFILGGTAATEVHAVKTIQVLDNPGAQLALSATANPVTNSQAFTYNVDVGQIGNTALANTAVRVRLPAGVNVGTISDGGTQLASGEIAWTIGNVAVSSFLRRLGHGDREWQRDAGNHPVRPGDPDLRRVRAGGWRRRIRDPRPSARPRRNP